MHLVTVGRRHSIPILQGFRWVHISMNRFKSTWLVKWDFELGPFDMRPLFLMVRQCQSRLGQEHFESVLAADCKGDKPELEAVLQTVFLAWIRNCSDIPVGLDRGLQWSTHTPHSVSVTHAQDCGHALLIPLYFTQACPVQPTFMATLFLLGE